MRMGMYMARTAIMAMTTELRAAAAELYRLMTWLSPAYPLGGFSYSHGVEYAVETGQVTNRVLLVDYIATVLRHGAGHVDAALLVAAWRAARADDDARLDELAELAAAWRGTTETALESSAQGAAFLRTTVNAWPEPRLVEFSRRHAGEGSLCIALGLAAAGQGISLEAVLTAYLQAFAANLVSAGVRLVPLGQTDGQAAIAALEPVVAQAAQAALLADPDEIGSAAPMLDWCSMRHETQYTRLFRS